MRIMWHLLKTKKSNTFFYQGLSNMCIYADLMTVCSYHVTYAFQSESTLFNCLARNRRDIWIFRDSKGIWTHNHLVRKRTLNHVGKLTSLLDDCVFLYELSGCGFKSCCCHADVMFKFKDGWTPEYFLWQSFVVLQPFGIH